MQVYLSGFDVHGGFGGQRGSKAPSTKPSVYVELEAHRRVTPCFERAIFLGEFIITLVESEEQYADFLTDLLSTAGFCYHRDFLMDMSIVFETVEFIY